MFNILLPALFLFTPTPALPTEAVAAEGRRQVLHERYESATGGLSVTRYVRDTLATR